MNSKVEPGRINGSAEVKGRPGSQHETVLLVWSQVRQVYNFFVLRQVLHLLKSVVVSQKYFHIQWWRSDVSAVTLEVAVPLQAQIGSFTSRALATEAYPWNN